MDEDDTVIVQPADVKLLVDDTVRMERYPSQVTGEMATFGISYMKILQYLVGRIGATEADVMENLDKGIYIGLENDEFKLRYGGQPIHVIIGQDDWREHAKKLCTDNNCRLVANARVYGLPWDRIGWLLPTDVTVQFYMFRRGSADNPIAHLLRAALVDTNRFDDNTPAVLVYARLARAEKSATNA